MQQTSAVPAGRKPSLPQPAFPQPGPPQSATAKSLPNGIVALLPIAILLWLWDILRIAYNLTIDLVHVAKYFYRKIRHRGGTYVQHESIRRPEQLVHDPTRKTVIVVGGSFAGVSAAVQLATDSRFQVILIEPKEFFEYTPGILRAMVAPYHHPELVAPLRFDNVQVIHGWAGDITPTTVTVTPVQPLNESSQGSPSNAENPHPAQPLAPFTLRFDYLVLAYGTTYASPIKVTSTRGLFRETRSSCMRAIATELANKKTVMIVGAGLVGVELAAEIAIVMPQVKVTLHSALPTILPGMDPRVIEYCHNFLARNGVEIKVNSHFNVNSYTPSETEAFFPCVGVTPSPMTFHESFVQHVESSGSSISRASASSSSRTEGARDRRLVVEPPAISSKSQEEIVKRAAELGIMLPNRRLLAQPSQHVMGFTNIFAVGDCALYPIPMPLMAFTSEAEGHAVARSIANLESGCSAVIFPQDYFHCEQPPMLCCISLGPYDGAIIFNQTMIFGRIAAYGKDFIEFSKVASVRQNLIAELIWAVGDPAAFAMSAVYNSTLLRFGGVKTFEWIAAGVCALGGAAIALLRLMRANKV